MDKYYVECGTFKKIFEAEDSKEAAKTLMRKSIAGIEEGMPESEKISFSEIIITSRSGFCNDIVKWGTKEQSSDLQLYSTPIILDEIGEDFIANDMRKWIKLNKEKKEKSTNKSN